MLQRHRKPSTLDFRCIGEVEVCDGVFRVSTLNLDSFPSPEGSPTSARFSVVIYEGMSLSIRISVVFFSIANL